MNTAVQELEYEIEGLGPDARKAPRQRICPDEHDRPDGSRIKRLANTDGVTEDYVSLEGLDLLETDDLVLECSKARRDAIGDLASVEQRLHSPGRTLDILAGPIGQHDTRAAGRTISHRQHLFEREAFAV